jgi:HlyD family secretion protein
VRRILAAALLVAATACAKKVQAPTVQTAVAGYRDIIVDAQAEGIIEPITIIDVKSKAGGVITQMPVETGTQVKPGDLIVQIDTRDVQNRFDQSQAQLAAAQAKLAQAEADKKRNEELFKARVITPQEYDNVEVSYQTANSAVVTAKANLDLAKQALEEATVRAPQEGVIITKNVAVGTVIASATGSVSGGTTIVQMADLGTVRIRALFNETDIGNVRPGEPANVTVDAYPDRRFTGVVEKIEPQAVVQQNVTMFPVLVNLENQQGLLRPGMNGEVAVLIDERDNVLAIPNDAIKGPREAVATGAMLGLVADSVTAELRAQGYNGGAGRGAFGGGNGGRGGRRNGGGGGAAGAPGAGGADGAPAPAGNGAAGNGASTTGTANGDVALIDAAYQQGQGGGFGQQGFGGQQVSDADCAKIESALKAHPKEQKQIADLRAKLQALRPAGFNGGNRQANGGNGGNGGNRQFNGDSTQRRRRGGDGNGGGAQANGNGGGFRGSPEMQAINEQLRTIYTSLGLDARTANACARRSQGTQQGARVAQRGAQGSALTPPPESMARPVRNRTGLVFVTDSSKTQFHPRIVQLGQSNLDFTEVVSGLKEGERVVMLGALAMQAQRLQQQDRFRQNASPLGGGGPGGGGRGGRGGR